MLATISSILTIFLVRYLGPEDYGIFALALSVASLVFLPADFGISQSTARFVAEHRGEDDRIASVLADGLQLKLIASGGLCLVLFAVSLGLWLVCGMFAAPLLVWLGARLAYDEWRFEVTSPGLGVTKLSEGNPLPAATVAA